MNVAVRDPISAILGGAGSIVDDLFTSDEERMRAATEQMAVEQAVPLAQIKVNEAAAKHAHWYVAGARPTVIWLCMAILAVWSVASIWPGLLDANIEGLRLVKDALLFIVSPLLGVSGYRTYEKIKGVARSNFKQ